MKLFFISTNLFKRHNLKGHQHQTMLNFILYYSPQRKEDTSAGEGSTVVEVWEVVYLVFGYLF